MHPALSPPPAQQIRSYRWLMHHKETIESEVQRGPEAEKEVKWKSAGTTAVYLADEYLVTALVPSEMACFESSPGRIRRTAVWISRDEMVERWLYDASFEASVAMRSKMSETNELRMAMALLLNTVSLTSQVSGLLAALLTRYQCRGEPA